MLPIELGWPIAGTTGWGLYGLHLALGLSRQGRAVHATVGDSAGITKTLWPTLWPMGDAGDVTERRVRFDPWGNHCPPFVPIPNRYRVLLAVFEDTQAIDADTMGQYDLILAPSRWVQDLLAAKGLESTIFYQGYDDSLFSPAPKRRTDGRFYVFSGGKLEFRKGQDIVVDAFRRFRETPEGREAVLVTAWQNQWPQTMMSIWESGYVQGVPAAVGTQLDISSWLELNGIPRGNHIDLGMLSQAEMANAIRECDVGVFPNRAEGATNMALVEALGAGLPCIMAHNTGQADLPVIAGSIIHLYHQESVLHPCPLYKGMTGWGETRPADIVPHLQWARTHPTPAAIDGWSWDTRTEELHTLLTERADG